MSKKVKLRVLKATDVARDTTVGKVYSGRLSSRGEICPLFGFECSEDTVSFYDDIGDKCGLYLNKGLVEILEQNCLPNSESQVANSSISLDQLQKLISEAEARVLIKGDVIKIWADNDVEVVAKDEADLLAKLEVFKAYNQMVNGGE